MLALLAFTTTERSGIWPASLGAALGVLGSSVHLLVNLNDQRTQRALVKADIYGGYTRLLLGPLVGWVFYFTFAQEAFKKPVSELDQPGRLLLFLPFLAGFSTKFVVGIINKALQAVEFTLGISDTGTIGTAAPVPTPNPAPNPAEPTPGPGPPGAQPPVAGGQAAP